MQIESNISQTCLDLLPRCNLSYAKIVNIRLWNKFYKTKNGNGNSKRQIN